MAENKCQECQGLTINYSGKGLNTQYWICSQWQKPGHKSEDEIKQELANTTRAIRPSGRFA
ncbi:hypothetical protein LCGC14_0884330 [marine sediment metagenome]|uniref:Uncharacterized protein n=1 Tax=marine sediment metagenome TaxID=412755 RepID=A0A0F9S7Y4_9ZZZZ